MPAALVLAAECSGCDSAVGLSVLSKLERLTWYLLLRGSDINAIHKRFCQVTASLREQGAHGRRLIDNPCIAVGLLSVCFRCNHKDILSLIAPNTTHVSKSLNTKSKCGHRSPLEAIT